MLELLASRVPRLGILGSASHPSTDDVSPRRPLKSQCAARDPVEAGQAELELATYPGDAGLPLTLRGNAGTRPGVRVVVTPSGPMRAARAGSLRALDTAMRSLGRGDTVRGRPTAPLHPGGSAIGGWASP